MTPSLTGLTHPLDNDGVMVEVLGPLLVSGQHISPRERTALAAFTVRRGRFIEADEIAEAIWGEDVPSTWRKQVQISVGRLRKHLGADRIETAGSSYALRLADDELDLAVFESLLDTARHRAAIGDHERAASSFGSALALWRGVPYGDVSAWPPAADEYVPIAARYDGRLRRSSSRPVSMQVCTAAWSPMPRRWSGRTRGVNAGGRCWRSPCTGRADSKRR